MRVSIMAGLIGTLICVALVAVIAVERHADRGNEEGPPTGPYVALGDSYSSGPKIPAQTGKPAGCARSDQNYPSQVAETLKLKGGDFRDMSCSGATITHLSEPQPTGDGVNPAQLSALSSSTRLVTLGIGGNDIGFSSLITQCVKAGVVYYATGSGKYIPGDAPCHGQQVSAGTETVRERILSAGKHLSEALSEVKRLAPHARVYVVGYPAILPAEGTGCGREMGLAPGDVVFLHQQEKRLNSMLRQRAQAAGAGYVDTYTPSVGRDACSAPDARWVEPLIPLSPAASVHPNERGERGMANAVLHRLYAP